MNSRKLLKYMIHSLASVLFFFYAENSRAAQNSSKYLFYIGGGEPVSQNPKATNFDYSFSYIRNMEKENWQARYLFAGDQVNSKKLRLEVAERGQELTRNNLISFLHDIESQLANNQLDKSQLMIYLDTHGLMENGKYTLSTIDGTFDILPSLLKIRALAKSHEVKLGIVGATCYSGQLISLEDENTCVITTAPSDTVGLMMNNNVIAYLLGHHSTKNLEDLHLQSRKYKNIELGQPLISTPAGKKAYEVLKELRTTVLLAGKKSAPEIYRCDQKGVEKTLDILNSLMSVSKDKPTPLIPESIISKLKILDQKLKSLLNEHRDSLVAILSNSCQSLNPDLKESPPCDLSKKEISERNTSTTKEQGLIVKPFELPPDSQETKPNSEISLQKLTELVQTSTQIGLIERDLYDLLYKRFAQDTPQTNICQSFSTL